MQAPLISVNSSKINRINNKLHLVEFVFSKFKKTELNEIIIIGAQHILPSTLTMFQSFFDRGFSPNNLHLIGKCYSSDFDTYCKLRSIGANVCPSSFYFNKLENFDSYYRSNIKCFAESILKKIESNKPIIILDDGGDLISYINEHSQNKRLNLACIEQTTSGYEKIKSIELNHCVINVARSSPKLQLESKIVCKTAVLAIFDFINSSNSKINKILIFGNGALGKSLKNLLQDTCEISVVDIDLKKSEISYEKAIENLCDFDIIIGCVGKEILSAKDIQKLKPGTTLISLSSSDREFDIVNLRQQAEEVTSCHSNFRTVEGINILNCGFPVNFTGNSSKVDIKEFELTRALLSLGILQAVNSQMKKGIIPLDEKISQSVFVKFLDIYPEYNQQNVTQCIFL